MDAVIFASWAVKSGVIASMTFATIQSDSKFPWLFGIVGIVGYLIGTGTKMLAGKAAERAEHQLPGSKSV
jgi:xanthosine utilization system XapX-like protein